MGSSSEIECPVPVIPCVVEKPYGFYPGVESFSGEYGAEDYCDWVEQSNGDPLPAPLALYVQDFCEGDAPPVRGTDISSSRRLSAIEKELTMQGVLFDSDRPVQQFLCSGAIATDWTDGQLYHLVNVVQESFLINQDSLSNWCACVGGVVPPAARIRLLRIIGFSSLRFACSDRAVNGKILDELLAVFGQARDLGIRQITLDLMCDTQSECLPIQALERFLAAAVPERVRLTGRDETRYRAVVRILSSLGYRNVGLDWFLQAGDIWLQARAAGRLYWTLLGFSDMHSPDVIGIGPGALSSVGEFYGVNETRWDLYEAFLSRGQFPVVRGIELEADDVLRREIMQMILATACIQVAAIEEKWGIQFKQFFSYETERLKSFEQKNWVAWESGKIVVLVRGYRELTELCRLFDHRMREKLSPSRLSIV